MTKATIIRILIPCAALVATLALGACGGSNNNNSNTCAITAPTFTNIYTNRIGPTCGIQGCHGSPAPATNHLDMGTQATAYMNLNHAAFEVTMPNRITPGDTNPQHSYLYLKISEATPPSGSRMPMAAPPLADCEIQAIATWIMNGSMNN